MMSDLKVALTLTADGKQLIGTVNNTQKVVSDLNTKLNQTKGASNNAAQGLTVADRQSSSQIDSAHGPHGRWRLCGYFCD